MNSSCNITVLVNDPCDIQPSQTTAMLIGAAVRQGHHVGVTGVGDVSCHSDGSIWARIRSVNNKGQDLEQLVKERAEKQRRLPELAAKELEEEEKKARQEKEGRDDTMVESAQSKTLPIVTDADNDKVGVFTY